MCFPVRRLRALAEISNPLNSNFPSSNLTAARVWFWAPGSGFISPAIALATFNRSLAVLRGDDGYRIAITRGVQDHSVLLLASSSNTSRCLRFDLRGATVESPVRSAFQPAFLPVWEKISSVPEKKAYILRDEAIAPLARSSSPLVNVSMPSMPRAPPMYFSNVLHFWSTNSSGRELCASYPTSGYVVASSLQFFSGANFDQEKLTLHFMSAFNRVLVSEGHESVCK